MNGAAVPSIPAKQGKIGRPHKTSTNEEQNLIPTPISPTRKSDSEKTPPATPTTPPRPQNTVKSSPKNENGVNIPSSTPSAPPAQKTSLSRQQHSPQFQQQAPPPPVSVMSFVTPHTPNSILNTSAVSTDSPTPRRAIAKPQANHTQESTPLSPRSTPRRVKEPQVAVATTTTPAPVTPKYSKSILASVQELQELLLCKSCSEVPEKPVSCTSCMQDVFCFSCAVKLLGKNPTCPSCQNFWAADDVKTNTLVKSMIETLAKKAETQANPASSPPAAPARLSCPNQCGMELSSIKLVEHLSASCENRIVKCIHEYEGCKWSGQHKKLPKHLKSKCHLEALKDVISNHKKQMQKYQDEIETLKKELKAKPAPLAPSSVPTTPKRETLSLRLVQEKEENVFPSSCWDSKASHGSHVFSNKFTTVACREVFRTAVASHPCVTGGKYYYEIINESGNVEDYGFQIGIVEKTSDLSLPVSSSGWSYSSYGSLDVKGKNFLYKCLPTLHQRGDRIGVYIDMERKTMSLYFKKLGQWFKDVFTNLPQEVYAAVTANTNMVSADFGAEIPK